MNVLIDTCIWSLAFRRRTSNAGDDHVLLNELMELIKERRALLIGPIVQEILSGVKLKRQFNDLQQKLLAFNTITIQNENYIHAAELYNHCRGKGVQGSHIDFLLSSVAIRNNFPIFTVDKDFEHYAKHTELQLHQPRQLNP